MIHIRQFRWPDYERRRGGLELAGSDVLPREDIEATLAHHTQLILVAEGVDAVVGARRPR